jgi:DNA-directed RNA polymerase subunit RPC12/RpoP
MEHIMLGWKKANRTYHFYDGYSQESICHNAGFDIFSSSKEQQFLSEYEITPDMPICQKCRKKRKKDIVNTIKEYHKEQEGFWDTSYKCPNCKTAIMFYNKSKNPQHFCTVCKTTVELPV